MIEYLTAIPRKPVPTGQIVAHNHVRPADFHATYPLGLNGFRAWIDDADDSRYEQCICEWANGRIIRHYKIRGKLPIADP